MNESNKSHHDTADSTRNASEHARRKKSFILHTDPFTVFQVVLFTMLIVFACVVVPILQTIREWWRQP